MAIGINLEDDGDRDRDVWIPYTGNERKTLIQDVFAVSGVVAPRSRYEVLTSLMEEVGELATEVAIEEGYSPKEAGKDGIIGEAIDIITCALDIIWVTHKHLPPHVLENKIRTILKSKLEKWKRKKLQEPS